MNNPLLFWDLAEFKAFCRALYSRLTGGHNQLLTFDQIRNGRQIKGQRDQGLQAVPLDKIIATERGHRDFDRAFFPRQNRTKYRWLSIAQTYDNEVPLPAVELLKVGEVYAVRDGNHRVSVARTRGQKFIDAHVTEIDLSSSSDKAR